jgi:hypothetical protein
LAAIAAISLLAGCAAISGIVVPGSVKNLSASAIGVPSERVASVSKVKQGMVDARWTATLDNGAVYECVADDMMHNARCSR